MTSMSSHVNRVMVTIDGTGVGDDALRTACELVNEIPGGTLTGVHVVRQESTPTRGGEPKATRFSTPLFNALVVSASSIKP